MDQELDMGQELDDADDKQHDLEQSRFVNQGWKALNCQRPWYNDSAIGLPEGTKRTVACCPTQRHEPGGFEWFWKDGVCVDPNENHREGEYSVYAVKGGIWVSV